MKGYAKIEDLIGVKGGIPYTKGFQLRCDGDNSFEDVVLEFDSESKTLRISVSNVAVSNADITLDDKDDITEIAEFFKRIDIN